MMRMVDCRLTMTGSNKIEYKSKLTDNFEKEISAFLNYKDGGIVYIGIDSDGKVIGCENPDDIQLKIKDKLKHNISPSCLGLFEVILEKVDDKDIVKIVIASGREMPYYVKLSSIRSQKQDLTFEQLKIYYEEKGLKLNEKFASNLELLTQDGKYNYVAYLMADLNGTSIKVAKYAGTDKVDLIENNEYGYCSLIKATNKVLEKLEVENKTAALITSTTRKEQPLWDRVALREAVVNAIVHNDYTTQNPPVFEIFSDRIEITSTGGLSTIKNIEDFFSGYSKPISREIMRIYKDLELVEHLGSGLNRILTSYGKESFEVRDNFMRNIFYKNTETIKNDEGVENLLTLIEKYPNKKTPFFTKELDTSVKNLERWIKQLRVEGKIKFIGSPKTGGYFVK